MLKMVVDNSKFIQLIGVLDAFARGVINTSKMIRLLKDLGAISGIAVLPSPTEDTGQFIGLMAAPFLTSLGNSRLNLERNKNWEEARLSACKYPLPFFFITLSAGTQAIIFWSSLKSITEQFGVHVRDNQAFFPWAGVASIVALIQYFMTNIHAIITEDFIPPYVRPLYAEDSSIKDKTKAAIIMTIPLVASTTAAALGASDSYSAAYWSAEGYEPPDLAKTLAIGAMSILGPIYGISDYMVNAPALQTFLAKILRVNNLYMKTEFHKAAQLPLEGSYRDRYVIFNERLYFIEAVKAKDNIEAAQIDQGSLIKI